EVVASTSKDHPNYIMYLTDLGILLQRRFTSIGHMDDLYHAITIIERGVALTPKNHPNYGVALYNLGNVLESKFERTGSIDDLDRVIKTAEQAVAFTHEDDHDRALCHT